MCVCVCVQNFIRKLIDLTMAGFPNGWFFITSPNGHVLTITPISFQMSQASRIELRPNVAGDHQLWSHDDGYLVNKHSGCVLAIKNQPSKGQCLTSVMREPLERAEHQRWEFNANRLVLITNHTWSLVSQIDMVGMDNS
ncbi:hypothetical protein CLU79DRAFT_570492 [Phycomyces nitens]|nr:hypothetical protein CLU79DRAFT_570492 [Phycomyces nitens]